MRNFWTDKVEKALRILGYSPEILRHFTDKEKEALIIDEYLYLSNENCDDCLPLSLEEMAEYIIGRKDVYC